MRYALILPFSTIIGVYPCCPCGEIMTGERKGPLRDLLLPKTTSLRPSSLFSTSFTEEMASRDPAEETEYSSPPRQPSVSMRDSKTVACIPCVKNHMSAVAGILAESKRFIGGGIKDPKIVEALDIATKEVTAAERGDLDPAKVASLPPREKEIAEWAADQIRDLRHVLDRVSDKDTFEEAIVRADQINRDMISKFIDLIAS